MMIWTKGPAARSDRRGKLVGIDRRRRPIVRQVGQPTLIVTSRTPKARPKPTARSLRVHTPAHPVPDSPTVAHRRRLRTVLGGLGLVALMGLTAHAVASVSAWLVPAYLALMVLIFVTPRGRRRTASVAESGGGPVGGVVAETGTGQETDRAAGAGGDRLAADPDPGPPADEATEPPRPDPDPAVSGTAKPRRSRARARKAAKTTAAEPTPDPAPVTWIRVGPGKFVRSDAAGIQDTPHAQAQAEDVAAEANPATDAPEPARPTSEFATEASPATDAPSSAIPTSDLAADANPATDAPEPVTSTPAEPEPTSDERLSPDAPEVTPGDVGTVAATDDCASGSVTGEYGIAPSASGPTPTVPPSVESPDHDLSDVSSHAAADPDPPAGLDAPASGHDREEGRPSSHPLPSKARPAGVSRGIANAIRGAGAASSRRRIRAARPRHRASVGSSFAPDRRIQQAARRAFGRIDHTLRAWRPRAPPHRL